MRIKKLAVEGYRGFGQRVEVAVDALTALVGQNDAGKSSLLTALGVFLAPDEFKIDRADFCMQPKVDKMFIEVTFEAPCAPLVLDAAAETNLKEEYLLGRDGNLTLGKEWVLSGDKVGQPEVYAFALHPKAARLNDLLSLKIDALRQRAKDLGVPENSFKGNTASSIRKAIWSHHLERLDLAEQRVSLRSEFGKAIWPQLEKRFPLYALFRADRPSLDTDEEAQDPLTIAVRRALQRKREELQEVATQVRQAAFEVANRTLNFLKDINPHLAEELHPTFADPAWEKVFKFTLVDQHGIPVNKKGSGTRRQILISFFRGEAERQAEARDARSAIVYAIEEPETAQHPDNQVRMFNALKEIAENAVAQVILTTHVPALAALLPVSSIRYVVSEDRGRRKVRWGDEILGEVAIALRVHPNLRVGEPRVVVVVEGRNDDTFLKTVSATLAAAHPDEYVNLETDPHVVILPGGGKNLQTWVERDVLRKLNIPEVYIFDKDTDHSPTYSSEATTINKKGDGSKAFITNRKTLENYIHSDAIREAIKKHHGFDPGQIDIGQDTDVPELVAKIIYETHSNSQRWEELSKSKKDEKKGKAKKFLNEKCVVFMSADQIDEEIKNWLREITALARKPSRQSHVS